MSFNRVAEFYKRAIDEHRFSEDFLDEAKSISSEDELRDFFKEKVLPIAGSMGYDFTVDELMSYEREVVRELSEEELENVAGGVSRRGISTAVMSFLMLVGNINPMTSAMLSKKDILESAKRFMVNGSSQGSSATDVSREKSIGASAGTVGELVGIDRSDIVDSVEPCKSISSGYVLRALNLLDPYALKRSGVTSDMRFFDGNTRNLKSAGEIVEGQVPGRKYNEDEGQGSPNYMRTLFPSSAGGLSTEGGFGALPRFSEDCKPTPELVARIAAYFHEFRNAADKDEMIKELSDHENILNEVGGLNNEKLFAKWFSLLAKYQEANNFFKFRNREKKLVQYIDVVQKKGINISKELLNQIKWNYFKVNRVSKRSKMDSTIKSKIEERLKEISGLESGEFENYINTLTYDQVKQYADILDELQSFDNATVLTHMKNNGQSYDQSVTQTFIQEVKIELSDFKKFVEKQYGPYVASVILDMKKDTEYDELMNLSKADAKKRVEVDPKLLEICVQDNLTKVSKFFEEHHMSGDVSEESLKTDIGAKKAKAIISVLKEGVCMIQNQETDDDKGTAEKYPKYTTERMLMSYFIEHFNNSSEVTEFYDEIDRLIESYEKSEDADMKRLNTLSQIIQEMPANEGVPSHYDGAEFIQNGSTKTISVPETNDKAQKEVSFSGSFADCADTAVRHFLNLLFYYGNENWSDVLPKEVSEELAAAKEAVVEAINAKDNSKKVEFRSLKERVQMFYLHQDPSNVNNGSRDMRSLWNYVISNMDEVSDDSGFYKISYRNKNYELDVGFINMLKLVYNIEKALYEGNEEKSEDLKGSKAAIESLVENPDIPNLESAIKSVIKVIKPKVEVKIHPLGEMDFTQDFFGAIEITLDDKITFVLFQSAGHAYIRWPDLKRKKLDMDLGEFKDDPIIKCFIKSVFDKTGVAESYDDFYDMFRSTYDIPKSKFLANSRMLRLLQEAAGETEENGHRLENLIKEYLFADADVSMNKDVNLFELFCNMWRRVKFKKHKLEATDFSKANLSEDGNYKYIDKGDGTVEICPTFRLKNAESITIPANIGGRKKYIISPGAFIGFTKLKELAFADDVEGVTLGDLAFSSSGIEKLTITASVQTFKIGSKVFKDAKSFKELNISDGVKDIEIGTVKFADGNLDKILVPSGVKEYSIPKDAFKGIRLADTVTISGSKVDFLSVEAGAFLGCGVKTLNVENVADEFRFEHHFYAREMSALNIAEGLKRLIIEDNVLACGEVKNFKIPDSVKELTLDKVYFYKSELSKLNLGKVKKLLLKGGQYNVKSLNIPKTIKELVMDGVTVGGDGKRDVELDMGEVEKLTLKDVSSYGYSSMDLEIPQTVKELTIDKKAFWRSNVQTLDIETKLQAEKIADGAFTSSSLKRIIVYDKESRDLLVSHKSDYGIGETVEIELRADLPLTREKIALPDYSRGTELKIPETVDGLTIEEGSFIGSEILNLDLGKVERLTLEEGAFAGFKGAELKIPKTVKKKFTIEKEAFRDSEVQTLNIETKLQAEKIADGAFTSSSLKRIIVYDEESRELLKENRLKYGISAEVEIRLGSDLILTREKVALPDYSRGTELKIPETVDELTIEKDTFLRSGILRLDLGKVERLILKNRALCDFKGTELEIPEAVRELTIGERTFLISKTLKLDLGKVERLTLEKGALCDFKGTELKIPETVRELTIDDGAFFASKVQILNIETKLQAKNIVDGAFKFSGLTKIIVHDEESKNLLEGKRSDYGIGENVTIELAADITA